MSKLTKLINKANQASGSSALLPIVGTTHTLVNKSAALHETKITLASTAFITAGAALAFGTKLFDFPLGKIVVHKVIFELSYVASGTNTVAADIGLGTATGTGAQSVLSGVGATAENIVDGQTATAFNSTTLVALNLTLNGELDEKDGSSSAKACYFNVAGNWNVSTTITYTGTITVIWSNLND